MAYGDLIYGDGLYKGEGGSSDTPSDIYSDPEKTCLILGLENEHGGGWSERSGDAWVWPSSTGAIAQLFDAEQQMFEVALDSRDGLFYVLNPIDGVNIELPYKDKVDLLVSGSGTEIECDVMLGEVTGEMRHYNVYDLESHLQFRPVDPSNFDKTGFDTTGLPTGFVLDVLTRQDGKLETVSQVTDVPVGEDVVQERTVDGRSHQLCLHMSHSSFKLTAVEQYCKVHDRLSSHDNGGLGTSEEQMQRELALPLVWISRGPRLLYNRATGRVFTGSAGTSVGPDLRVNSAFTLSAPLDLGNAAISNGLLMLWYKIADGSPSINELSFVVDSDLQLAGSQLAYFRGSIPSNIVLPSGIALFDVRLYSSAVTVSAVEYYADNVINHSGDVFLP